MSAVLAPPMPASVGSLPPTPPLVTAEEFMERYANRYLELVNGLLVEVEMPSLRHGRVCVKAARFLDEYVDDNGLGRVFCNDSLFLIRRNPDTMRGPDVSYYSFTRMPPGPAPEGVCAIVPELTVEVKSPSNSWPDIAVKVAEYRTAGVIATLVLDPDRQTATVYLATTHTQYLAADTLTLPDVLPGFAVPVAKFFE